MYLKKILYISLVVCFVVPLFSAVGYGAGKEAAKSKSYAKRGEGILISSARPHFSKERGEAIIYEELNALNSIVPNQSKGKGG